MSYDDQYDAPLSGPERVRVRALELAVGLADEASTVEQTVEAARELERYVIGSRSSGVQERLDAAYGLADKLLANSQEVFPDADQAVRLLVDLAELRELVKMLSGLADMPF